MKKSGRYKTSHLVEDQYEPGSKKEEYFKAVRVAIGHNYQPMEKVFDEVLKATLSRR